MDRTHQTHIKQQNKTPSIFVMVITVEILSSHQSRKKKNLAMGTLDLVTAKREYPSV